MSADKIKIRIFMLVELFYLGLLYPISNRQFTIIGRGSVYNSGQEDNRQWAIGNWQSLAEAAFRIAAAEDVEPTGNWKRETVNGKL
jgi:hypothetical protein